MKNARRYDDRITIGAVPDSEDLAQLAELGYRTLIDLRDERERFGGQLEQRASNLGLRYVAIPIGREEIAIEDVQRFYDAVFERGNEPIYACSLFGKKPLAFLLLFEAVAARQHVGHVFRRARQLGLGLDGDLRLQTFLIKFINEEGISALVESIRKDRADLVPAVPRSESKPEPSELEARINEALRAAAIAWRDAHDVVQLRRALVTLLELVSDQTP